MRRLAWSTPPTSQTTWMIASPISRSVCTRSCWNRMMLAFCCATMRETLECARCIRHEHGELELTAAGDEALLDDLVNEGNVDVAAGQDADDLLPLTSTLLLRTAASGAAPEVSTTCLQRSSSSRTAEAISSSETVTTRSTYFLIFKGLFARSLYRDTVRDGVNGIRRLCAHRCGKEFAIAGAPSACTPMIWMRGLICLAQAATPEISPPPPAGTKIMSTNGRSRRISSAMVP